MGQVTLKTTVKLRAKGAGISHSRMDVAVRDLTTVIDEPTERGGTNLGVTPTDTALAALAGCTNVIGNKCAEKLGIDAGHIHVDIVCDFDRRGVTLSEEIETPFVALIQRVTCTGSATKEELAKLGDEVAKYCPLAKLFINAGTEVTTTWDKA
ncbi:MAG: OsmC family protein [Pseudomonadota bacterium]